MPLKMRSRPDVHNGVTPAKMPTYFLTEAAHLIFACPFPRFARGCWPANPRREQAGTIRLLSFPLLTRKAAYSRSSIWLSCMSLVRSGASPPSSPRQCAGRFSTFAASFTLLIPCGTKRQVLTERKSPFLEQYAAVVSIPAQEQVEMQAILDTYLKRIEWDEEGNPIRLYPFTRLRYKTAPPFVVIHPRIRSGQPCIAGTGVPTSIIAERYEAERLHSPRWPKDYGQLDGRNRRSPPVREPSSFLNKPRSTLTSALAVNSVNSRKLYADGLAHRNAPRSFRGRHAG